MTNLNLKFYEQLWILNITNFNYSAMRTSTWQHDVFSSDPWVALARKEFHPNKKRSAIYLVSSHKFTPWAYLLCFVSKSQKHSGIESLTLVKPMELSFTVSVGAGGIISLFFENHWVLQVSMLLFPVTRSLYKGADLVSSLPRSSGKKAHVCQCQCQRMSAADDQLVMP